MDKSIHFDVSGIMPEGRETAAAVARVLWEHSKSWFVGLVCFGSAVKGGFIPGASDLDIHLYLNDAAFASPALLRLDIALAIQADLARINPAPFRYIDAGAESGELPEGHVGPIPGNYHLVAGVLPVAEATVEQLVAQAKWSLERLVPLPPFVSEGLLHHGAGRGQLALTVRALCQTVWPVLYQVCCLRRSDALRVWQLPKQQVIPLLPPDEPMGQTLRTFHSAMMAYYPGETSLTDALRVIETAVAFLQTAADWAAAEGLR